MIELLQIKRSDPRIMADMAVHYSQPRGFVGRNICYAICCDGVYYGSIVGGSATLHLVGRDEFFAIDRADKKSNLRHIVNNIFYHIERNNGRYPVRNIVPLVLQIFRDRVALDWWEKYGDTVIGFESLIELPRTGEAYKRDGWIQVGVTKGYTCKRVSGKTGIRTDSWTGRRVWNTDELRPKAIFVRHIC